MKPNVATCAFALTLSMAGCLASGGLTTSLATTRPAATTQAARELVHWYLISAFPPATRNVSISMDGRVESIYEDHREKKREVRVGRITPAQVRRLSGELSAAIKVPPDPQNPTDVVARLNFGGKEWDGFDKRFDAAVSLISDYVRACRVQASTQP